MLEVILMIVLLATGVAAGYAVGYIEGSRIREVEVWQVGYQVTVRVNGQLIYEGRIEDGELEAQGE